MKWCAKMLAAVILAGVAPSFGAPPDNGDVAKEDRVKRYQLQADAAWRAEVARASEAIERNELRLKCATRGLIRKWQDHPVEEIWDRPSDGGSATPRFTFQNLVIKKQHIKKLNEELEDSKKHLERVKKNDPPAFPQLFIGELTVGRFGQLGYTAENRGVPPDERSFQIIQIIDETNVILQFGRQPIWLTGVSTAGFVDDEYIRTLEVFEVVGTRRWGSTTIYLLEPFEVPEKKTPTSAPSNN